MKKIDKKTWLSLEKHTKDLLKKYDFKPFNQFNCFDGYELGGFKFVVRIDEYDRKSGMFILLCRINNETVLSELKLESRKYNLYLDGNDVEFGIGYINYHIMEVANIIHELKD